MTDLSNDSTTLALSPPYIVDATPNVKSEDPSAGVPLVGVPLRLTGSGHLKVVVDPPSPGADSVALHFNGSATPIDAPVTVDPATKRTTFEVSRALLRNGLQFFHYVAKRIGGADEPSPKLWVLYSRNRPGGLDPVVDDKDIQEALGIDLPEEVKQKGVDLVVAEQGVALTISYVFAKLHDEVTVDCNGFLFTYTVKTNDLGGAFDILLPKAAFVGGGNSPTFAIFYRVKDQLGNHTQNSLPSPSLSIKVDLTPKIELPPAPFVPTLVGNVIYPNKHTTGFVVRVDWAKGFKPGDKAKLVAKGGAAGAGTPVFTFVALNANFRANFQLTPAFILANAGLEVVFTWILLSGGKETESEPLTLAIESVNVTDPNFPIPEIVEAYGDAVDLRTFTGDAHIFCASWPFIAAGQKFWLHVLGTGKDGNPKTVAIAVAKTLTSTEIQNGLDYVLPRKELELFEPGKELRVRLRVDFFPNKNADTIQTFTLKRYTLVTAGMNATLEFIYAPYVIAPAGIKSIELKATDENGEYVRDAKVYVTIPSVLKYFDGGTGRREFQTDSFGRLVIKGVTAPDLPNTHYSLKAELAGLAVTAGLSVTGRGKTGEADVYNPLNDLALSPDGNLLYAIGGRGGCFDVLTLENTALNRNIFGHNAFAISLDGEIGCGGSHNGSISVLNLKSFEPIASVPNSSGFCPRVFSKNADLVWCVGNSRFALVNARFARVEKIFQLRSCFFWDALLLSPDERYVFISNQSDGTINKFDVPANAFVGKSAKYALTPSPYYELSYCALSPDGRRIYVSSHSENRVVVLDSANLQVIQSVSTGKEPGAIAISPDGRLAFYGSRVENKIRVFDTLNFQEVRAYDVPGVVNQLRISPDGACLYVGYRVLTKLTVIRIR